jgi:hypothetical protein
MYDFGTAQIETGSDYVTKPGNYLATIGEVTLTKPEPGPDGQPKNPFLTVAFDTKHGKVQDKFYITQKALGRLKALFKGMWAKDLDKTFKSVDEVGDFFIAASKKAKEVGITVFMEEANNGKFYSRMPFNDFISFDLSTFEERLVEPTDPDYASWVYKQKPREAPATSATVQGAANVPAWNSVGSAESTDDDLPF